MKKYKRFEEESTIIINSKFLIELKKEILKVRSYKKINLIRIGQYGNQFNYLLSKDYDDSLPISYLKNSKIKTKDGLVELDFWCYNKKGDDEELIGNVQITTDGITIIKVEKQI